MLPGDDEGEIWLRVGSALVRFGWAIEFRSDGVEGFFVSWSSKGIQRHILLSHVLHEHEPDKLGEMRPAGVGGPKSGALAPGRTGSAEATKDFWLACIEELGLKPGSAEARIFARLLTQAGACSEAEVPPPSRADDGSTPRE